MRKTVTEKVNGKINIGLNITGCDGAFHALDSVMAEINLSDTVTVRTRKDYNINLDLKGESLGGVATADNNVYKSAKAFMEEFGTFGADITLKKNIPVGSGLGGSSADIVATVKALAKAYEIEDDLLPLIRSLCSDGEFLYNGGFARVKGRGCVVEQFSVENPIYFVLAVPESNSSTVDVFNEYDSGEYEGVGANIDALVESLKNGEGIKEKETFNALAKPAMKLNGNIKKTYEALKGLNPISVFVSGSGSSVVAVFQTVELCSWAMEKVRDICPLVYVRETINRV